MKAKIVSHLNLAGPYYRLQVFSPLIQKKARPGQFVMLKAGETLDPLLRRPFSIHRVNSDKTIEILYKVIGRGTRLLAALKKGADVDILGPLGNGFIIDKKIRNHIIVAGGIGIAPFLFLCNMLARVGKNRIVLFTGGRNKDDILCIKDFKRLKAEINISTEDGSMGKQGLVTGLFETCIADYKSSDSTVYSCGPNNMQKKVYMLASLNNIFCQVSLEARMGCGIGACLGCAVEAADEYKYVCKNGPVFDAGEIQWERL